MMKAIRTSPYFSPDVIQAVACEGRYIKAYFDDGSVRRYNMQSFIDKGGVFKALQDDDFFRKRITAMNGTVAWNTTDDYDQTKCIDIAPEIIFQEGEKVIE